MGFTTSLRVQKRDLKQGFRLARQEYDVNREAFRCAPLRSFIDLPECIYTVNHWRQRRESGSMSSVFSGRATSNTCMFVHAVGMGVDQGVGYRNWAETW